MSTPRILVGGIGNIFLGDDAFGVEVVKRLAAKRLPRGVEVVDFGIKGLDLTYALLDGYDAVILVDAVPRGQQPGTVYVIEPEPDNVTVDSVDDLLEAHSLDPAKVLRLVRRWAVASIACCWSAASLRRSMPTKCSRGSAWRLPRPWTKP